MVLHCLAGDGSQVLPDCRRLVVCDSYHQPIAVYVDDGSQIMCVSRGEKGFEELVGLTGIGKPARTVDVSMGKA